MKKFTIVIKHFSRLCLFVVLLLGLIGCGASTPIKLQIQLNFYRDNNWEAYITIVAPNSYNQNQDLNEQLQQLITRAAAYNIDFSDDETSDEYYTTHNVYLSGQGFLPLSDVVFQNQAIIERLDSNGRQKVFFALSNWQFAGQTTASLVVYGWEIKNGNGSFGFSENAQEMKWEILTNITASVTLIPFSCLDTVSANTQVIFLPAENWIAKISIPNPPQNCTIDQVQEEFASIESYSVSLGVKSVWKTIPNSTSSPEQLSLILTGSGFDNLSSIVFDGAAQIYLSNGAGPSVIFDLPANPPIGFQMSKLDLEGLIVQDCSGNQTNSRSKYWEDFTREICSVVLPHSPLYLINATLTVVMTTGQEWSATFSVAPPVDDADWWKQIQSYLQDFFYGIPSGVRINSSVVDGYYILQFDGRGAEEMNFVIFHETASFQIDESGWLRKIIYVQREAPPWDFFTTKFIIKAGTISDGNGTLSNISSTGNPNQSMSWENLDTGIYATFTEYFDWKLYSIFDLAKYWGVKLIPLWIALIVSVILLGLFFIGLAIWKRIKVLRKSLNCPECGTRIPPDGGYCPNCGRQRPSISEDVKMVMATQKIKPEKRAVPKPGNSPIGNYFLEVDNQSPQSVETGQAKKNALLSQGYLLLVDGRQIALPLTGRFTVGSLQQSDLRLPISNGQNYLLSITYGKTRYFLEILTAPTTVYLNQRPVNRAINLDNGDRISIGNVSFSFRYK